MPLKLEKVRLLSSTARSMPQIKRCTALKLRLMVQITPRDVHRTGPSISHVLGPSLHWRLLGPSNYMIWCFKQCCQLTLIRSNMLCIGKLIYWTFVVG